MDVYDFIQYIKIFLQQIETLNEKHRIIDVPYFIIMVLGHRKLGLTTIEMMIFITLVLEGISMRGAAKAMEIFFLQFQVNLLIPSWYAGRFWMMRLVSSNY